MSGKSVILVCQFGPPVRGVSFYGDDLLGALQETDGIHVEALDYRAAYPGFLHPGTRYGAPAAGLVHWANPLSWYRAARTEADIIHIQHWLAPMACYLAPLAYLARRAGRRVVITVHNPAPHETMSWTEPFEDALLRQAHALVAHDRRGAAVLADRLGPGHPAIRVIPFGIRPAPAPVSPDPDDYRRYGLDPRRRYVCLFGNLRGYKGVDVLLRAWRRVIETIEQVDLIIAGPLWTGRPGRFSRLAARMLGTHGEAGRLAGLLADPALAARVRFFEGFQSHAAIDAFLRVSALAVFPYVRFSSQSGAACRAAGLGRPLLVSDVGGLSDLALDGDWMVPPGDADALAGSLLRLLRDPATLRAAAQRQLDHVREYSWERVAAAHAQLYRDLA